MSRITQRKGDIAKSTAIAYFTKQGYDVGLLLTESAPYDLLVDTGNKIYRVQVKYSSASCVDIRRIHSNSSGYVVRLYGQNDFDWLFIYNPKRGCFLIKNEEFNKSYISLQKRTPLEAVWLVEDTALKAAGV